MTLLDEFLSAFVTEGAILRGAVGPLSSTRRRSRALARATALFAGCAVLAWAVALCLPAESSRERAGLAGSATPAAALFLALLWVGSGHGRRGSAG